MEFKVVNEKLVITHSDKEIEELVDKAAKNIYKQITGEEWPADEEL